MEDNFIVKQSSLIIFYIALIYFSSFGQSSFVKWIGTDLNEKVVDLKTINDNQNYLLNIARGKPFPTNPTMYTYYESYKNIIYRTDANFILVDSIKIKSIDGYEAELFRILKIKDDTIILAGRACDTSTLDFQYCMVWLDADLNILKDTLYGQANQAEYIKNIILSVNDNYLFYGLINPDFNTDNESKNEYIQFYHEMDDYGNVIQYIIDTLDYNLGWLRTAGNSGIYHGRIPGIIYSLNSTFEIIDSFNFPVNNFSPFIYKNYIDDTYFILGEMFISSVPPPYPAPDMDVSFILTNPQAEVLSIGIYGVHDTLDRVGNIDFFYPDTLFIGATKNFIAGYHDSWFLLYKTDTSGLIHFENYYGGYGRYALSNVLATPDGGCILAGNWWDFNNYPGPNLQEDVVIMKVDANGLITSTNKPELPFEVTDILVYPNPGDDYLMINSAKENLTLKLFNLSGTDVLKSGFDKNLRINTSHLKPAPYIYSISQNGQEVKSGKWIKK